VFVIAARDAFVVVSRQRCRPTSVNVATFDRLYSHGWSKLMRLFAFAAVATLGIAPLAGCMSQTPDSHLTLLPKSPTPVVAEAGPTPASPTTTTSYTPPPLPVAVTLPALNPLPTTPIMKDMNARPISGGTLAVLSDGRTAVAADSDRDQVYIVDLASNQLSFTVTLQAGDEPGRLIQDAAGLVHVALRSGGAVATIDPKTGTIVGRRALCAAPRGLAVEKNAAGGSTLHVACAGGELVSIDASPSAQTPTRSLNLGRDLRDVVVSSAGRLLVSTFRTADVMVIAADGTVNAGHLKPNHDLQDRATGVAWRMLPRSDGTAVVLHETNTQDALATTPGGYGQTFGCGSIVTSTVTVIAPDDQTAPTAGMPLEQTIVGADVALSPDGQKMAVVSIAGGDQGNQVAFFDLGGSPVFNGGGCWPQTDASTSTVTVVAPDDQSGMTTPDAYLPPNGEIVAVAYDKLGNVIVQSREPATLQILTQRVPAVTLSTDSRFDSGHQLFHTATTDQVACVSCHPEGGEDGRVWTFQLLGERRTQSLRGGIMDTAPFHWSGDEPNMTMLMTDVFQGRMAGGKVDTQGVGALASWLDKIPTIPTSQTADVGAVVRGQTLFASAGCVSCHNGPDFTNGQTVSVGTGGASSQAFQVPQLHGLAMRAPYMHDGCAATLHDRFATPCGGGAMHGNASTLSEAQLGDLIAYLETL
jgi:mono/diheme cytochrome c family protein